MTTEKYKNIIIGSGEGGKYLAWHLAQSGQQTVVIERRWISGSCPNVNCLPSKNEIWSAKVAGLVHHGDRFGMTVGTAASDMAAVRKRKREMVEGLIAMHLDRYKASAELVMGEATFTGSNTLEVRLNDGGVRTLASERIFLNLGTHASIPSVPGLAESEPLTNIEALELDRLPEHLIVIGGGYVGIEFAQAYRRFGSRVTIRSKRSFLPTRTRTLPPNYSKYLVAREFASSPLQRSLARTAVRARALSSSFEHHTAKRQLPAATSSLLGISKVPIDSFAP